MEFNQQIPSSFFSAPSIPDQVNKEALTASLARVEKFFTANREYYPLKYAKVFQAEGRGGATAVQVGLTLSIALLQPVEISRIKACVMNGGLDVNLLNYLMLVCKTTHGEFGGVHFGSKRVSFLPQPPYHQQDIMQFQVDTKMSCSMEAFRCIPIFLIAAKSETETGGSIVCSQLQFQGATDSEDLQFEYLDWVLIPTLEKFIDMRVETELLMRGFQINGKGYMSMNVWSLTPGTYIQPIVANRVRQRVVHVRVRVFRAGGGYHKGSLQPILDTVHEELEEFQQKEAELFGDNEEFKITDDTCAETSLTAYGSGMGVLVIAETKDGSIIAGQSMGSLWFILEGISGDTARECAVIEGVKASRAAVKDMTDQLETGCCSTKGFTLVQSLIWHWLREDQRYGFQN
eukprot:TRINITY_DN8410_c1_g1_i1.p1 TRINITY_DN8410_c1_g1~~TRINITY_DN8410_c1_g1_i1.p1  ORF type:complete len:403 (+),score=50.70 TRINITY_DN8410_c1_g1_i1:119-1327(+)